MTNPDVIVIGAGIVGAACAVELQARGRQVLLLDRLGPGGGTTAAGMGHLVALDESDDELDLCLLSLRQWDRYVAEHGHRAEHVRCGTLWVAEDEDQLLHAAARAQRLARRGWQADLLSPAQLAAAEPALRPGLAGAVRVAPDGVVYPPAVARHLADQLAALGGATRIDAAVARIDAGCVHLQTGQRLDAHDVVVAAGCATTALLPDMPVFPRKGHLAITDRYPGRLRHQVVSMGYGQTAAGADGLAVAANVQPRPTGQWLIGSCRQDGIADAAVDPKVLAAVLRSAIALLPELARLQIIRAWTGMRPASADGRPIVGAHPTMPRTWLAAGHEGLGVTTAFGTAQLLADLMAGQPTAIDAAPYSPARFTREIGHD
ncbi:NAD(P)/FAD-dependent oxidoreductase [Pseudoduganella armeniaca]|uniref:D-amino-acid oxidase n=1 Tax=Pseudoduganella armeniaca TaxID=2072590 RepID=A0A2R4C7W8_9BURK|nr:FAD-dependent oxidoreductase [Pseudoduganella armeniaca]AVR95650.1 D-amino-acid oxidase [Pseudoduganella armeniaca]